MTEDSGKKTLMELIFSVPVSVWIFLIGQATAGGLWIIKLTEQINDNTKLVAQIQKKVDDLDKKDTQAGQLLSERVNYLEKKNSYYS